MGPGHRRCKGCSRCFLNADKCDGNLGRNAQCLETYVSGGAGASAGGILDDSEVAMAATDAARLGNAHERLRGAGVHAFQRQDAGF